MIVLGFRCGLHPDLRTDFGTFRLLVIKSHMEILWCLKVIKYSNIKNG